MLSDSYANNTSTLEEAISVRYLMLEGLYV